jgi:hypothetical protein
VREEIGPWEREESVWDSDATLEDSGEISRLSRRVDGDEVGSGSTGEVDGKDEGEGVLSGEGGRTITLWTGGKRCVDGRGNGGDDVG